MDIKDVRHETESKSSEELCLITRSQDFGEAMSFPRINVLLNWLAKACCNDEF
jgi:hypothetical protein